MDELIELKKLIEHYIDVKRLDYANSLYGLGKREGLQLIMNYINKKLSLKKSKKKRVGENNIEVL